MKLTAWELFPYSVRKAWRVMRITTLLILVITLHVSARTTAQKITLSANNISVEQFFSQLEKQTGFSFISENDVVSKDAKISINVKDATLESVLDQILTPISLSYKIEDKTVHILKVSKPAASTVNFNPSEVPPPIDIHGRVTDSLGNPLAGASVTIKGSKKGTTTDANGGFDLKGVTDNSFITISFTGYKTRQYKINGKEDFSVALIRSNSPLDEIQVIAYGTISKRLNTGDVSTVGAQTIEEQPVSNPLAALEGQVSGLVITQSSGVNGASYKVQIRGQNSILQGTDPYFIVDGVPFAPGNNNINQLGNASTFGLSPFNLINPADIETIEVLKDADATAIYGSRGANGVIIITTKKGKVGKTRFSTNFYAGVSQVTRTMGMLNTQQYVQMRREAFSNDGITPSSTPGDPGYAPDIMIWDTTRYTDMKKLLIGGTANVLDAQGAISGGNQNTQFLFTMGYHHETTVFPTDLGDRKISNHLNLTHNSADKKFGITVSVSYVADKNELSVTDLTQYVNIPPNTKLYDSTGKLNWQEGGVPFFNTLFRPNPLALFNATYTGDFQNMISNVQLSYNLFPGFSLKANMGYNLFQSNEQSMNPSTSIDPNSGGLPYSYFSNQTQKSWIVEPQLEYVKAIGKGKLTVLLGGTWQENSTDGLYVSASNYSSDILLGSISGAGSATSANTDILYRYEAFFGRLNYNWEDKYLINLTGRRDGSSRFGPAKQFSNFGAIGAAWIFTNENWFNKQSAFLDFGKLRGSYGKSGNDQIGDYKYLDTWTGNYFTYQGRSVLDPTSLYNPNFTWESNEKFEVAIDLGFARDRFLFTAAYYNNKCSNQLINYTLPIITGFNSVLENLNAVIENSGVEFQVTSKNIISNNFSWTTTINASVPRNKLVSFPGLESSSYATIYTVGKPVSSRPVYEYKGVDPQTGVYSFEDVNHDGVLDQLDKVAFNNVDPKFYGGMLNSFTYENFQLDIFFQFQKQNGYNYLNKYNLPAYSISNQPDVVLGRWQQPGDNANIQRFTASVSPALIAGFQYLGNSNAVVSDASFLRCKNVALSYNISSSWLKNIHLDKCRIYVQAQNVFTITNYVGSDPETQNMFVMPPLKTITAGIQLTL